MLYVVTSSRLCKDDFYSRIEKIASANPDRIILREKYLSEKDYFLMSKRCSEICGKYGTAFSVNSFTDTARKLSADLHIPLKVLEENPFLTSEFDMLGVSVHSVEEAVLAEKLGAKYIIAGHVYATDCKLGLPPRGIDFLREVCNSVQIPVLAIGGITKERLSEIYSCGADGICIMSHFMTCDNVKEEIRLFKS